MIKPLQTITKQEMLEIQQHFIMQKAIINMVGDEFIGKVVYNLTFKTDMSFTEKMHEVEKSIATNAKKLKLEAQV